MLYILHLISLIMMSIVVPQIVEAVVQMLLSAIREHSLHPEDEVDSSPLNSALVMAALQSDNPKLHRMVILYLKYVATENAKQLIAVMESAESDPSLDEFEYDIDGKAGNSSEVRPSISYAVLIIVNST